MQSIMERRQSCFNTQRIMLSICGVRKKVGQTNPYTIISENVYHKEGRIGQ